MKVTKRRKSEETSICIELVNTINKHAAAGNAPNLLKFWHTPNGGRRSKAEGGLFKAMGVLAGVPDYLFLYSTDTTVNIAFLEMKNTGGSLSKSQQSFNTFCIDNGIPYGMARSVNDALVWLEGLKIIGGNNA